VKGGFWTLAAAIYLGACLLLGGASAAGLAANAFLQLLGLGLIVALLWRRDFALPDGARGPLWIGGALLLVGLLSLVPLPLALSSGTLRGELIEAFRLIGMAPPSLAASLAPPGTLNSLLHLLPAAAMFLLALRLPNEERRLLPMVLLAVAGASVVLGAFQLMGGQDSPLRFYAVTSRSSPVGFFANTNHEATLLLCALPLTAVIAGRMATRRSRSKRSGGAIISVSFAVFLMAGIAICGSSAGYGLAVPAAVASFLIYRRTVAGRVAAGWWAALAALVLVFAYAGLQGPLGKEAFEGDLNASAPSSRRVLAAKTTEIIKDSFPIGTGLGTFSTVYRRYEDPNQVTRQFANHAHNDYLEAVMELGAPGLLLILAFLFWWGRSSYKAWGRDSEGAALARAGSVMIGIVLAHSIVDYPIRTAAIVAVFALACALMVPPAPRRSSAEPAEDDGSAPLRHIEAV
jgi:O-antigen ligase